jgi:hypothetical protein
MPNIPLNLFPFTPLTTDLQNKTPFSIPYSDLGKTQLGVPAISWITFNDFIVNGQNIPLQISECLISVTQRPRVTKSYCVGKDTSTKTYIGLDDYEINIEGYIYNVSIDGSATNMEGIYPIGRVDALLRALAQQGRTYGLSVDSPKLNIFGDSGIDYIVITDLQLPEEEGQYSQQKFSITAISDSLNDAHSIYSPYNA